MRWGQRVRLSFRLELSYLGGLLAYYAALLVDDTVEQIVRGASFDPVPAILAMALITLLTVLPTLLFVIAFSLAVVIFAPSVTAHLAIWCSAFAVIAVALIFLIDRVEGKPTSLAERGAIVLCITLILFYCWNRWRPIRPLPTNP